MADDKVAKIGTQAVALPSDISQYVTNVRPEAAGEGARFALEDVAIPRLGLVQKTSKEIEPGPRLIPNAKFTDIFHSSDRTLYGNGPVAFAVLRYYDPRWVQFRPMDEGGGIIDLNVPAGDPRTLWDGNEKPIATKYLDYIILILNDFDPADPMKSIAAISFKSMGLKAAKELNRLMQWRGQKDLFRGVYLATSFMDQAPKGAYAQWKFANAGWLSEGTPAFEAAREAWEALKHVQARVEREGDEPDPDFDHEELERQSQAAASGRAPVTDM